MSGKTNYLLMILFITIYLLNNSCYDNNFKYPDYSHIPSNLSATDDLYNDKIVISWDVIESSSGYSLYRSSNGDEFTFIASLSNNQYEDFSIEPCRSYYYKVQAHYDQQSSDLSEADVGSAILDIPNNPDGLSINISTTSSLLLTFNSAPTAEQYNIYRSYSLLEDFTQIYSTSINEYTDKNLVPNTSYYYKVSALNCGGESSLSEAISATTENVRILEEDRTGDFTLTLEDLNQNNVYFIFTNTSTLVSASPPSIYKLTRTTSESVHPLLERDIPSNGNPMENSLVKGKPEIDLFNQSPYDFITRKEPIEQSLYQPRKDTYGETINFYIDSVSDTQAATCRKVITAGTAYGAKTINIWVADNCWYQGGTKAYLITPQILDTIADILLKPGEGNDLYDWEANIFGEEWGAHSNPDLITSDDEITILLMDIDDDNSYSGGTLGYFYAKDNFKSSVIDFSNERIMIYIDSVFMAAREGSSWEISDYLPSISIATLAHEMQHLIHFYQKFTLRNGVDNSEVWIDEMLSMQAEDLLADKLLVNGPREVDYNQGDAGNPGITEGVLPLFNYYVDYSLINWDASYSYGIVYALGSYLVRNYGGPKLLRDILHNSDIDYNAIDFALNQNGYSESFKDILVKWGIANLISDMQSPPMGKYQYNSGDYFSFLWNGIEYKVGSINLYNYIYDNGKNEYQGPYIYQNLPSWDYETASNLYFQAGENLSGSHSWEINMDDINLKLSIVIR